MTPAVHAAKKLNIPCTVHAYTHDPATTAYGREAARALGLPPDRVWKTLVVDVGDRGLVVAVIPVSSTLNLKLLARAAGGKNAALAEKRDVERVTGYVLGGVSPLGQKKHLPTYIDDSARLLPSMYVSAGRRGLELELAPGDLLRATSAQFVPLCR